MRELRACLVVFALLAVLTGIVYPMIVTLLGQALFPRQARGSLILQNGKLVGSDLIGQQFTNGRYFWGRPSATMPEYNGASSGGSNLGPTNPDLLNAVKHRVAALRKAHPEQGDAPIPVDLVTASASGLDPQVSPAAIEFQVARVARVRGLSETSIRQLVANHVEGRTFGILGEPRVNVLRLNLALDELQPDQP